VIHLFNLLAQANTPSNNGAGGAIFAGGFLLVFMLIALLASVFWLWMLIDCLISNKPAAEKVLWFLVIFFLHIIGAVIYFFIGRGGRAGTVA
jgi:hypothetical protein